MDTAASCYFISSTPFSPSSSPSSSSPSPSPSPSSAFLSSPPLTPVPPARACALHCSPPRHSHRSERALTSNPSFKPLVAPFEGLESFDEVLAGFVQHKQQRTSTATVVAEKVKEESSVSPAGKNGQKSEPGGGGGEGQGQGQGVGVKKDYYSVLGLKRGASPKEIRVAYRSLALQFHPDVSPIVQLDLATQTFSQINEAYAVLSDPQRRMRYDLKLGHESPSSPIGDSRNNNYAHPCVKPYTDTTTGRVYPSINSLYREWRGSKR